MTIARLPVDRDRLAAVCARYGIESLLVFGSYARGCAGPDSDVDVLYELRPGSRIGWDIEELAEELSELFGRKVDLVARRSLHKLLAPAVLAEAKSLYAA